MCKLKLQVVGQSASDKHKPVKLHTAWQATELVYLYKLAYLGGIHTEMTWPTANCGVPLYLGTHLARTLLNVMLLLQLQSHALLFVIGAMLLHTVSAAVDGQVALVTCCLLQLQCTTRQCQAHTLSMHYVVWMINPSHELRNSLWYLSNLLPIRLGSKRVFTRWSDEQLRIWLAFHRSNACAL